MIRFKVHATCDEKGCQESCHPTLTCRAGPVSKAIMEHIVLTPVDIGIPEGWTSRWSPQDRATLIKCPKHSERK